MYTVGKVSNCSDFFLSAGWQKYLGMTQSVVLGFLRIVAVRPIINWTDGPDYKLSRHLVRMSEQHATLPYYFDIRNRVAFFKTHLIDKRTDVIRHQEHVYAVGSKSFRPDQLFKVTNKTALLFFNIVSLYFNTLFN